MKTNDEIIQMLGEKKQLKKSSIYLDKYSLNLYSKVQGLSLMELIQEADDDEENIHKVRRRRISERLDNFVKYLENDTHKHPRGTGYNQQSIHDIVSRVRAFYNYYEIQLPKIYLPKIPSKERSTDLPTIDEIQGILKNTSNIKHKAIIKFMLSSGLSSNEVYNLTKKQFIEATSEYHNSERLFDVLDELKYLISKSEAIIPTWELTRGKTNYSFITFNSPEATRDIVEYLTKYGNCTDERLFQMNKTCINDMFLRASKRNNIGYTEKGHNKFHSHAMRKVFATTLAGAEINDVPLDSLFIEFLLGHKLPGSMEPYYKNRPKRLKKIYVQIVDKLSIENLNQLDIKSPEYLQLEREKLELEKQNKHNNEILKAFDGVDPEMIKELFKNF